MAIWTYDIILPSPILNATVKRGFADGIHKSYDLTPNTGYVLHDKGMDVPVFDEETGEFTGDMLPGFRTSTASCGADYDFEVNPREFYAVLASEVPEDRIFGVVQKPEIM